MDRRSNIVIAGVIVIVTVVFDQLTKWWAETELDDGSVVEVLPTLEFDLAYNSGFSFGTGGGLGPWIGVLVTAMCVFLGYLIVTAETRTRTVIVACILGGAVGNLIDRLFRADDGFLSGEVIDFIDVTWYAVFNVADMFVVCGALAFGAYELRTHKVAEAAATQAEPTSESDPGDDAVLTDVSEDNGR